MKKFLRFLGFGDDEPGDYAGDYRRRRPGYSAARDEARGGVYSGNYEDYDDDKYERVAPLKNGLIFFRGLPSDKDKLQLREALIDGCIIVLDMRGIPSDKIPEVKQFLTFMEGVSFANNGEVLKLAAGLFSVSPQPGIIQIMTGASASKTQGDEV